MLNCTVADILRSNEFPFNLEVFVDNLFVLENNDEDIIPAADMLIKIFEQSSMPLHEIASNCKVANAYFKDKNLLTKNSKLKLLGMIWDYESDAIFIKEPTFETTNITKRSLLSNIARIFDPIGFLGPLLIQGRMLVQETLESNFSWDDELPTYILEKWNVIIEQIKIALLIPIPRWVDVDPLGDITIHAFTDSSDRALGVVVYLVTSKGSVFISSKPKVCPMRMSHFTVTRKELTAVALGTRHLIFVIEALSKYIKASSHHIWCDSTLALPWCTSQYPA